MELHRLAWMLGVAELAIAAVLVAMGEERTAGNAIGLGLWMLTFALGGRGRR